jgi:hypothetical protein
MSVVVAGLPTVNVAGLPTVNVAGLPTVDVAGLPTVDVAGLPTVDVAGLPTVPLPPTAGLHEYRRPAVGRVAWSGDHATTKVRARFT